MDSGFSEAERSGNDAHAIALPVQLSNFLTMDDHSIKGAPRVQNFNFLARLCGVLRTLTR